MITFVRIYTRLTALIQKLLNSKSYTLIELNIFYFLNYVNKKERLTRFVIGYFRTIDHVLPNLVDAALCLF